MSYCPNCGAAAQGNFCCVCGTRLKSSIEMYRLEYKRARKRVLAYAESESEKYIDGRGWNVELRDYAWSLACNVCNKEEPWETIPNLANCQNYVQLRAVETEAQRIAGLIVHAVAPVVNGRRREL